MVDRHFVDEATSSRLDEDVQDFKPSGFFRPLKFAILQ